MSLPLLHKYDKKMNIMYCPECKEYEVTATGSGTIKLPAGLGFIPGDNKFSVALIHYKGWVGECDLCGCEVFNWTSKKVVNTYPKSINDKLKR